MFRVPFITPSGLVVSEHPLASVVGAKVLNVGGNAVDAAIAVSFALSVVQPQLSSLGGDYFALIYDSNRGLVYFINGSGYSPKKLTLEFIRSLGLNEIPVHSPYSVTVPGMVDALYRMWCKFGSLEWCELIKPSIRLAKEGFPQYPSLVNAVKANYDLLSRDEGSRKTYLSYEVGLGNRIVFSNLAKALELIADDPRSFYEGEIARSMVSYLASKGGVLELEDLREYKAFWDNPLKGTYRDYEVFECPPNTQGITTLHILKLLNKFDLSSTNVLGSKRVELFLKCFKAAYAIRDKYVGDPRYVTKDLLSDDVISELLEMFESGLGFKSSKVDGDTTYYVVVDKYGNVVSGIQSVFYAFGSGITDPEYGITLNCRASSFNVSEGGPNSVGPRKLPLHTLSCVMMFKEGGLRWVLGTSGGHYRPQIHVEIITNIVDYGLDPQTSVELPRFLWDPDNDEVVVEEGLDVSSLNNVRVKYVKYPSRLGVAAVVGINKNIKLGVTDIRGDGLAIGLEFP